MTLLLIAVLALWLVSVARRYRVAAALEEVETRYALARARLGLPQRVREE